ncbi:MAG: hypothetical protein ABI323_06840 [Solirubrobacteraceae bacterium]
MTAVVLAGCGGGHKTTRSNGSVASLGTPVAGRQCPVSRPGGNLPAGVAGGGEGEIGNSGLATYIGQGATVFVGGGIATGSALGFAQPDGSIFAKFLWVRDFRASGVLRVTGRDLFNPGERLVALLRQPTGPAGEFVPSHLVFRTSGCWQVNARSGPARLAFVVRVLGRDGT